jgi:hypothetical protein
VPISPKSPLHGGIICKFLRKTSHTAGEVYFFSILSSESPKIAALRLIIFVYLPQNSESVASCLVFYHASGNFANVYFISPQD